MQRCQKPESLTVVLLLKSLALNNAELPVLALLSNGSDTEVGFIYANLSQARVYERLGYRTFFHDISDARCEWTILFALPWLPMVLLLYLTTGHLRILPWKRGGNYG